jgi:hypothetical protein
MKQVSPLLEAIQDIYWQERGVGFGERDTRVVWHNPDVTSDAECGLDPLLLEEVPEDELKVVRAHLVVGWQGDFLDVTPRSLQTPTEHDEHFADRLAAAYSRHDHDICLAGLEARLKQEPMTRTASFAHRDYKTGEVIEIQCPSW